MTAAEITETTYNVSPNLGGKMMNDMNEASRILKWIIRCRKEGGII